MEGEIELENRTQYLIVSVGNDNYEKCRIGWLLVRAMKPCKKEKMIGFVAHS